MKNLSIKIAAVATTLLPAVAFAQETVVGGNVSKLLREFGNLVNMSIGILVTLALAVFFFGLVRYIFKLGGDKGAENGKNLMIYGIVALFIMVSIWGIINFVGAFFGVNQSGASTTSLSPYGKIQ